MTGPGFPTVPELTGAPLAPARLSPRMIVLACAATALVVVVAAIILERRIRRETSELGPELERYLAHRDAFETWLRSTRPDDPPESSGPEPLPTSPAGGPLAGQHAGLDAILYAKTAEGVLGQAPADNGQEGAAQ